MNRSDKAALELKIILQKKKTLQFKAQIKANCNKLLDTIIFYYDIHTESLHIV